MEEFLESMNGFRLLKKIIKFKTFRKRTPLMNVEEKIFTKDIFADRPYKIGEYTYGKPIVLEWGEATNLKIGKFCSIADEVKIFLGGNHRIDWISTYPFCILNNDFPNAKNMTGHPSTKGDVIIGNDVWIGFGATILSGAIIGDGAVIGTNAVVTKNVDPYSIVAGNPAKIIKKRFNAEIIDELLKIAWWNWPIEKIDLEVHWLCQTDIMEFIKRNKSH